MLVCARDRQSFPIQEVLNIADTNDPGYGYLAKFNSDIGLPFSDTGRYTRAIGLNVGQAASFSVPGWRALMAARGAIGVVGLNTAGVHVRVISALFGDSTPFGTFVTVHDPGDILPYTEVFATLAFKYESAAFINHRMDQIWHR